MDQRAAIVTGGSRGIGRAITLRLAARGAGVVMAAHNLSGPRYGEQLMAATGPDEPRALSRRSLGFEGDLPSHEIARALVRRRLDEFSRIDILINDAGGSTS